MSTEVQEQEILAKKVKHNLENWREVILPIYDVLLWKNISLHPGIIFGISTSIFVIILLLDPTLLSFISSLGLILVLSDYIGLTVIPKIFNPDSWTGPKEKKFDEICLNVASVYVNIKAKAACFFSLKESKPTLYYSSVISVLLFLSFIGSYVNNVFLTYLFVTVLLMLPGLKHNGYLMKIRQIIRSQLASLCKKTKKQ